MKFEYMVLLFLVGLLVIGGWWADNKISKLENALAEKHVDTVTVTIPLVKLDTVIVTQSDTVFADVDTIYTDSGTIINHYQTATVVDSQPLFTGTYTYKGRSDEWTLKYEYRNLGIHLEFPDKFDFRKVQVTTIPSLGNISVSLNDNYKPYKPPKGISLGLGVGYVPAKNSDALFLSAGLIWKNTYVGALRSESGWGFMAQRIIFRF